jgi:hypothetical protein
MALTEDQQSGLAYIQDTLREYGFSEAEAAELTTWAKEEIVNGSSPILVRQRLWEQPAFKRRFKVIFDRRDRGLPAISPSEVLEYERRARQLFQEAGLPPGFYDSPDDFYNFMLNDVSISELNGRVEIARTILYSASQEERLEMKRLYGLTDGQEIAYVLDSSRALPLLQNQFNAARTSGAALRSGYGQLFRDETERLAMAGVSTESAERGFGSLVQGRQLFNALPGLENTEDTISREEQLSGTFTGNAFAAEKIRRRAEMRVAAFSGGGTFVADREGFAGLGSSNS